MNRSNFIQGYVEVKYKDEWGYICDDIFEKDHNGAKVLCSMMGYKYGLYSTSYRPSSPPASSSKILLDDVKCRGNETHIWDCEHAGWGIENCKISESVAIRCSNAGKHLYFRIFETQTMLNTFERSFSIL